MASAQVSASLSLSLQNAFAFSSARTHTTSRLSTPRHARIGTTFATGSPLFWKTSPQMNRSLKAGSVSIRCEQGTKGGNGLDVWLGRLAMVGFAAAITVEVSTGKGLLENFGLAEPLPLAALAVTALVGVLTAVFIFQSASEN